MTSIIRPSTYRLMISFFWQKRIKGSICALGIPNCCSNTSSPIPRMPGVSWPSPSWWNNSPAPRCRWACRSSPVRCPWPRDQSLKYRTSSTSLSTNIVRLHRERRPQAVYGEGCKSDIKDFDIWREKNPDAVIVDPPRTGLPGDVADMLGMRRFPVLIYVSCEPSTLAISSTAMM